MVTPCPRCGTTNTESVRHGFVYHRLWNMGYHLRQCAHCNRKRLFKRGERMPCRPDEMTAEELTKRFNRKIEEAKARTQEYLRRAEGKMASNLSEGSDRARNQPSGSSGRGADVDTGVEESGLCPKCGSAAFRRSRRKWYEKIFKRPRMARCLKCRRRFPYPVFED